MEASRQRPGPRDGGDARGAAAGGRAPPGHPSRRSRGAGRGLLQRDRDSAGRRGQAEALSSAWHSLVRFLLTCEVPTCALVQGRALGAGAELALACDFVFAETTANFGFPEIHRGSFPPVAAVLLERRTGRTKAADLILCGAAMTAEAAERRGLVNALVNPGDLVEALDTMQGRPPVWTDR
ncbi:MAG: enoyl-CoA hydratase/isomerase family protein [Holophagales bacterium]|nr:enoyl-CoA hydratase/isomerase family protein [Holophagales bacterium]